MRAVVERRQLAAALVALSPAIPTRPNNPVLASVHLRVENERLTIRASDSELAIERTIDATVHDDGETLVSGLRLRDLVTKFSGTTVNLTSDQDSGGVHVASGRSEYRLATMRADVYPEFPAMPKEVGQTSAAALDAALKAIGHAVDDSQVGACQGVVIEATDEELWMIATDKFRAGICPLPWKGAAFAGRILYSHAQAAMKNVTGEAISVHADGTRLAFVTKDAMVSMSQLAGDGIKWRAFTEIPSSQQHEVDREDLEKALDRTALVLEKGKPIIVDIASGEATLTSADDNAGGEEQVVFDGDVDFRFALNPSYMSALLGRIPQDRVVIATRTAKTPLVVRGLTEDGTASAIHVVMPVALPN